MCLLSGTLTQAGVFTSLGLSYPACKVGYVTIFPSYRSVAAHTGATGVASHHRPHPPGPLPPCGGRDPGVPLSAGSPRPPRNVRRLVPAPLPTRGSTARAAASRAALQPGALSPAPLSARLRLQPGLHRRLAPPRCPAGAQPSPGPHAALERRLRRVSAPAPASPPDPLPDPVWFYADLESRRGVHIPASLLLVLTLGLLTAFLLFLAFAFSFGEGRRSREGSHPTGPSFLRASGDVCPTSHFTQGLACALWDRVLTEVGLPKPWASIVSLKAQASERLENLYGMQSKQEDLELGSPETL